MYRLVDKGRFEPQKPPPPTESVLATKHYHAVLSGCMGLATIACSIFFFESRNAQLFFKSRNALVKSCISGLWITKNANPPTPQTVEEGALVERSVVERLQIEKTAQLMVEPQTFF